MSWPVLPHGFLGSQAATGDQDTYQIQRSLRFNSADSAYLDRTPASAGNLTTWTWSGWFKRSKLGASQTLFSSGTSAITFIHIQADDTLRLRNSTLEYVTTQVFRDVSAWYHLVVRWETGNGTAGDRVRVYINGSEINSFSTETHAGSNEQSEWNKAQSNQIGRYAFNGTSYFDGYLTEINFIDGQALTPSSFGETDAITGRWKAKAYSGTYGTNGFYLPFSNNSGATTTTLGKDNSTYRMLTAQLNGTSNGIQRGADLTGIANGKSGTVSMWWNFTGASSGNQPLWTSRNNSTIGTSLAVNRTATGTILVSALNSSGTTILYAETNSTVAASAGVYHIYATWDLAVNNQIKIYVNGVDQALTISTFTNATIQYSVPNHGLGGHLYGPFSPTTPGMVGQVYVNYSTYLDPTTNIGKFYGGANTPVSLGSSGEIPTGSSPIVYLDGDATSILANRGTGGNFVAFGTLSTGTTYQGTGLHYNNWTPNNFSVTAGVGNDSLVDSPTNYGTDTGVGGNVVGNYAVLNPNDLNAPNNNASVTLSNGNLDGTLTNGANRALSTIGVLSGKWYAEVSITSITGGVGQAGVLVGYIGGAGNGAGGGAGMVQYQASGNKRIDTGSASSYGASYTTNDIIGIALDMDSSQVTFYKNNSSQGAISLTSTGQPYGIGFNWNTTTGQTVAITANFGQRPFAYTAPSGFKALCTTNLPIPTIRKPSSYMDVVTYTGNGATQTISGLGFSPDLVWIKSRSGAANHGLHDTARVISGDEAVLYSNTTDSESIAGSYLSSFNSNGFTLNANSSGNGNGSTYVAWAWDEAPIAGMDIVSYTGTGVARTVAHNLGVAPKMMIVKNRTSASDSWAIYHSVLGAGKYLLFTTGAETSSVNIWNNTAPTSSVFSVGITDDTNRNSGSFIAYLFAEFEGFSKFGSYTGNGSSDGTFVFTGMRPRWVMIKRTDVGSSSWNILDSERDRFNVATNRLQAESSAAETAVVAVDYLSNGFKLRDNGTGTNASGGTYIFAAFAESPFKYARAR